jgi:hypothetical protein
VVGVLFEIGHNFELEVVSSIGDGFGPIERPDRFLYFYLFDHSYNE